MFSAVKKLFCYKKVPRTPMGFCDCPSRERQKYFWCRSANEDRYRQSYDPENSFHEAVCMGKLKEALQLLASRNFNTNDKDTGKRTALHFACFYGHLDLVYFLLFNGSEINALDKKRSTPLMKAIQSREAEIVSVLLDQGADPNLKDTNGESAIHMAVYVDSLEIVSSLLDFAADIEDKTKDGFTPLLLALRERKLLIAEYLITHGANIHACDKYQRTTLMYAVKWDSNDLVELLLKKGVGHSSRDRFRWSALMYAIVGKRQVKRTIVNHVSLLLSRNPNTYPGRKTEDTFSSGQNKSASPTSMGIEDKANCVTQKDIPETTLGNGADDLPTASTEHENIEAEEEELELETIPDFKPENKDDSDKNGEYQNLESSQKAAHSPTVGNDAEVNEMNQVWAIKCPHPELRDKSNPICIAEYEIQQSQADKDFSQELKEEMPELKPEEERTFDKIEEIQKFSASDPNELQEASREAPHSSSMDNDTEKNERKSGMEDQRHTSDEEQGQHNGRKKKRTFIGAVRDFFCSCFTKNHSSSSHQKK